MNNSKALLFNTFRAATNILTTRNILDCDQSNVLLAHLFDAPWGVSYRWSMVTRRLSGTVIEIFSLEDIEVTTLTFGVT